MYFKNMFVTDPNKLKMMNKLHRTAATTKYLVGEDRGPNTSISSEQKDKLEKLERVLDWHVLRARCDDDEYLNSNPGNCSGHGEIIYEDHKDKFASEKALLQDHWIDFPMVSMNNFYSSQWNEKDTTCKNNSFSYRFASHFDLNNVTYNYNAWLKAVEEGTDEEKAFENLVVAKTQLDVGDMVVFGKKYGRVTKISGKDISVHVESESSGKCTTDKIVKRDKIKIVKKPWCQTQAGYGKLLQHFKAKRSGEFKGEFLVYPDIEKESVFNKLKDVSVDSKFGGITITETLLFDQRLLDKTRFENLDAPVFCMPSILRSGDADFHSVYFEGNNAMGQLKNWATIIICRKDQIEEYIDRYASEHTYFVAVPDRVKDEKYKGDNPKLYNGYSAGDSKYYCYRIPEFLHNLWESKKKRCIVMDDQMNPFCHQISFQATNPYNLREKINTDRMGNSLFVTRSNHASKNDVAAEGKEDNSRFPLTHAAMALYWDKVADIMKSGVVSASSKAATLKGGVTRDTSDIAMGLMVWLLDFDVIKEKLGDIPSPINPAYNAAEDLFMRTVVINRGIQSTVLDTMRVRKSTTGGGTCGRATKPSPMSPVIKFQDCYPKINMDKIGVSITKIRAPSKGSVIEVYYPFTGCIIHSTPIEETKKTKKIYELLVHMCVEIDKQWYHVNLTNPTKDMYFDGTKMSWNDPYGCRHRVNMLMLRVLANHDMSAMAVAGAVAVTKSLVGTRIKQKWKMEDGKEMWFEGKILKKYKAKNKYQIRWSDGETTTQILDPKNKDWKIIMQLAFKF